MLKDPTPHDTPLFLHAVTSVPRCQFSSPVHLYLALYTHAITQTRGNTRGGLSIDSTPACCCCEPPSQPNKNVRRRHPALQGDARPLPDVGRRAGQRCDAGAAVPVACCARGNFCRSARVLMHLHLCRTWRALATTCRLCCVRFPTWTRSSFRTVRSRGWTGRRGYVVCCCAVLHALASLRSPPCARLCTIASVRSPPCILTPPLAPSPRL